MLNRSFGCAKKKRREGIPEEGRRNREKTSKKEGEDKVWKGWKEEVEQQEWRAFMAGQTWHYG